MVPERPLFRIEQPAAAPAVVRSAFGRETILLAEDSEVVRALVREILERKGYNVLVATDGPDAIGVCSRHEGPVHLILTDVVMPGMNGRELYETLAPSHPDAKVLYMSGYTDDAVIQRGILHTGTAYLQKPFLPETLAQKVREVLDGDSARPTAGRSAEPPAS